MMEDCFTLPGLKGTFTFYLHDTVPLTLLASFLYLLPHFTFLRGATEF